MLLRLMLTVAGLPGLARSATSDQEFFREVRGTQADPADGAMANAGDVNQDGYDDLIVAKWVGTGPGGSVRVYSGLDGTILHRFSEAYIDGYGIAVAGEADVNADDHPDVIVAAWTPPSGSGYYEEGNIFTYSGLDGSLIWRAREYDWEAFGVTLAVAGDINQDGHDDVLTGSWDAEVVALSGADGSTLQTYAIGFGFSLASVGRMGDADLDGFDDVLAGNAESRIVKIYSGRVPGRVLLELHGELSSGGSEFGASVTGMGDLNGDGYPDVAVGAPNFSRRAGAVEGKIYLFSGKQGARLAAIPGANGERLGERIVRAGDLNGDGCEDMLASSVTGRNLLISGFDGRLVYSIDGKGGRSYRSAGVGVGDLDQDGYPEFAVAESRTPGRIAIFRGGNWPQLALQASPIVQFGWSTARVHYATPNATVYLCATYDRLGRHVLGNLNVTLSLLRPFLIMTSQADAAGQADFRFRAGNRHPDLTIFLQACEYGATSNWLYREL